MVVAALWNQFRSKAQPPLNLLSDVFRQTCLRGCPDRRGHSSTGRYRCRDEARSLARIQIKRFPNNMTMLIDVARQEQKRRTRHGQRIHVGQFIVLPQDRATEVRPSSRQTYDLTLFIIPIGSAAELALHLFPTRRSSSPASRGEWRSGST